MSKFIKVKNLILSLLIALGLFMLVEPMFVSALVQSQQNNQVFEAEVKADDGGYSQVIIKDSSGKITFLTEKPLTHATPQISGQKVVWMAQIDSMWQIFLDDISIEKTTQLTNKSNNVNPQISGDYIVWEGIRNGAWQILLFDGIKITQLTQGDAPKQDVTIKGNTIAFSQKEGDVWQVHLFDIVEETFTKVSDQSSARNPVIEQDLITWESFDDEGGVYFEYDMKDKKLKKLDKETEKPAVAAPEIATIEEPQPAPEPVVVEDIMEELNLEEITEVPEIQESTPSAQETPTLEDLLDIEDTEESTTSGD